LIVELTEEAPQIDYMNIFPEQMIKKEPGGEE
jgi:hypothetical protein